MKSLACGFALLSLLVGGSAAIAQTEPPASSAPLDKKIVQYEGVPLTLLPPTEAAFYELPEVMALGKMMRPNDTVFAVAVNTADFAEAMQGTPKDFTFAIISTPQELKGQSVSEEMFTDYKEFLDEKWGELVKQHEGKGKSIAENINADMKRRYNVTVDEKPSEVTTLTDLGFIADGERYITKGLLSKNNIVRFKDQKRVSNWVQLFATVLVKDKVVTLILSKPYISPDSVTSGKAIMAQWVSAFLARNP